KSNNNIIHTNSLNEIKSPSYNIPYHISSVCGEKEDNNYNFKIYYNDTMVQSIPTTINTLSNIILLENGINKNVILKSQILEINNQQISNTNLLVVNLLISSCFIMALIKFAPLILNERINYLLYQLQLNGVTRNTYWLSCFITYYNIFIFSIGLIVLSGVLAKFELLLNIRIIMVLLILLIIWYISTILFQYILSFLFDQMDTIYIYIYIINFCSILLVNISKYNYLYDNPYLILNIALTLFSPLYSILPILNSLFSLEFYNKSMRYELNIINILKFRNGTTPVITCSIILIFIYYGILIKLDKKKNQTNKSDIRNMPERALKTYEKILEEDDEDVKNEFEYVKTHQNELPICVYHIKKEFRSHVPKNKKREILRRDSITFNYGETHQSPINGPNGAGKSTTINIISSIIPQTTGKITFNGIENFISRLNNFSMRFCSQIDILWNELTIREHLELYLKIHGYNNEDSLFYASQFINIVGIEEHQNKRIEKLSGGTKRKLSFLIAICKYPKYILLDEPTGGMDPSTRRLIWNIIKKVKSENNTSLILTTHSLEEAENLCDRLSILICCSNIEKFHNEIIVNGKLFGNEDYQIEKLSFNRVKYSVILVKKLGKIFEISLEQVFIDFARKQVMISDD
ncbi:P-loop containing nucleoside triphosphate hydrolase protein, partial [Neocallimastix lanati (nom. inval.)]